MSQHYRLKQKNRQRLTTDGVSICAVSYRFATPLCNIGQFSPDFTDVLVGIGVCNVVPTGAVATTSYQVSHLFSSCMLQQK